jgi:hypothetical protein
MSGAITWTQVSELLGAPTDLSQTILKELREKLIDKDWLNRWMCGDRNNPRFFIAFEGTLTEGDKKLIETEYLKAGWGFVTCTNSAESGESPGMCGVTLQRLGQVKPATTTD